MSQIADSNLFSIEIDRSVATISLLKNAYLYNTHYHIDGAIEHQFRLIGDYCLEDNHELLDRVNKSSQIRVMINFGDCHAYYDFFHVKYSYGRGGYEPIPIGVRLFTKQNYSDIFIKGG